jgi:hypothetical protein
MLSLFDYINEEQPVYYEKYYESVFKKIDIYNRNTQLITEGRYRSLPTIIQYTPQEQLAISEMIYSLQFSYLENYLSSNECINEVFEDEIFNDAIFEGIKDNASKVKILLQKGKDKIEEFIKRLVDKIPENIKKFYESLSELAKTGIKTAKDLIKKIGKILSSLAEKLEDALEKLGLYRDEVVNDIQDDQLSDDISNDVITKLSKDNDKLKMNKFIVSAVYKGYNNKSIASTYKSVNECFNYETLLENEDPEMYINEGLFSWLGNLFNKIFGFSTDEVLKDSEHIKDDTFKTQFIADTTYATRNKTAKEQIIDFAKKIKNKSIKTSQDELEFRKKCANDFIKNGEKTITKDCLKYVLSLAKRLKKLGEQLKDDEAISLYRQLSELIQNKYENDKKTLETASKEVENQTQKIEQNINKGETSGESEDGKPLVTNNTKDGKKGKSKGKTSGKTSGESEDGKPLDTNDTNDTNDTKDGKKVNGKKIIKGVVVAGALASTTVSLLPIALLTGGYLTYKTLKWIGPKLSNKLEPFLLSDKTKAFVDKLYNNPIAKYGLGLRKSDNIQKEESKLMKFYRMGKSILVNLVIATLISSLLGLFISNIFSGVLGATAISLIVASMLAVKNIAGTIFNRILNFSKETKTKDGKKIKNNFFDVVTLVSILASVMSVVLQIPGVKEWFANVFEKLRDTNIKDVANAVKEKTGYYINGKFVKVEQTPTENIIVPENETAPIVVEPESKQPYTVDKNGQPEQIGWDKVAETAPETKVPDPIGIMYRTEEGQKLVDNMEYCSEPWLLDFTDKATGKTTGYNMVNDVMVDQMQKLHIDDGCVRAQFFRGNDGNGYIHVFLAQDKVTVTDIYKYGSQISATKEITGAGIEAIINIGDAKAVTKDNCTEFINFFMGDDKERFFDVMKHAQKYGTDVSREIVLNRDTGEVVKAVVKKI